MNDDDYDPSLNERLQNLPDGEKLVWKGGPEFWPLARRAFHIRGLTLYFGALIVWRVASALSDGRTLIDALSYASMLLPLATLAIGLVLLLAWLSARNTSYAITTKRVLIKSGIALTGTLNLPLRYIESAGMKVHPDGTGDFPLSIAKPERVAWLLAWPNVRPWRLTNPEPMLRALPNPDRVANALAEALGGQVPRQIAKASAERSLQPGNTSPGMTAPTAAMPS
jgi:hypothetical protein